MTKMFNIVQTSSPLKEEFRIYTEPQYKEFHTNPTKYKKKCSDSRYRSNLRAKRRLKELIDINFYNKFSFITLTFKENIQDITTSNKIFSSFIRKLKYYLKKKEYNFKYICVIETQKRGAIHYHMICNLPNYISYSYIIKIWNASIQKTLLTEEFGGFVHISNSENSEYDSTNIAYYLSKYLIKKEVNPIFFGKKVYFTSRNIKQPIRKDYFHTFPQKISKETIHYEIEKLFQTDISDKKLYSQKKYINKYTEKEIYLLEYKKT